MKDFRLSARNKFNVVSKIPILNHKIGDFSLAKKDLSTSTASLIVKHTSHIREIRRTIEGGALASGTKMIEGSLVTKLRCSGKNIMVKTFRDGTKNVWEEVI